MVCSCSRLSGCLLNVLRLEVVMADRHLASPLPPALRQQPIWWKKGEERIIMEKKMKQWCCKNKHILGFIRWNGNELPQLMVLRDALDMGAEHPHEVDLLGPLDGQMPVRCSICDDVQFWEISVESLLA